MVSAVVAAPAAEAPASVPAAPAVEPAPVLAAATPEPAAAEAAPVLATTAAPQQPAAEAAAEIDAAEAEAAAAISAIEAEEPSPLSALRIPAPELPAPFAGEPEVYVTRDPDPSAVYIETVEELDYDLETLDTSGGCWVGWAWWWCVNMGRARESGSCHALPAVNVSVMQVEVAVRQHHDSAGLGSMIRA